MSSLPVVVTQSGGGDQLLRRLHGQSLDSSTVRKHREIGVVSCMSLTNRTKSQPRVQTSSQVCSLRLLLSGLLSSLGLGSLDLTTKVSLLSSSFSVGGESVKLLLLGGDGSRSLWGVTGRKSGEISGDVGSEVVTLHVSGILAKNVVWTYSGISLLGLAGLSGEDDQSRSVLLQSVDVEGLSLLALAPSSVVNDNSETLSLLLGDTSELDLGKGESSSLCSSQHYPLSRFCELTSDSDVVSLSGASDGRSQSLERSTTGNESLLGSSDSSRVLLAWLVELE